MNRREREQIIHELAKLDPSQWPQSAQLEPPRKRRGKRPMFAKGGPLRIQVEERRAEREAELDALLKLAALAPVPNADKQLSQRTGSDDHLELGAPKRKRRAPRRADT